MQTQSPNLSPSCWIFLGLSGQQWSSKMSKGSLSVLDFLKEPPWPMMLREAMLVLWFMPQAAKKPGIHVDICSLCHCLMLW